MVRPQDTAGDYRLWAFAGMHRSVCVTLFHAAATYVLLHLHVAANVHGHICFHRLGPVFNGEHRAPLDQTAFVVCGTCGSTYPSRLWWKDCTLKACSNTWVSSMIKSAHRTATWLPVWSNWCIILVLQGTSMIGLSYHTGHPIKPVT